MAAGSRGKSGGVRVIYYYHSDTLPIFLITVYSKSQKSTLTQAEKRLMKQIVQDIVSMYTAKRR